MSVRARWILLVPALVALAASAGLAGARPRTRSVPEVRGLPLPDAYARLHRAGFAVTFAHRFAIGDFECTPVIAAERPAGATVVLQPQRPACGAGSPGVPTGPLPVYRVPNLRGLTIAHAMAWIEHRTLYGDAHLAPLVAGRARTLLANYVVTRQRPRPGTRVKLGIGHHVGNTGSFLPTPLVVFGRLR